MTPKELRELNHQIDCKCGCADKAYFRLISIDLSTIQPWKRMKIHYMRGKHLYNQWCESSSLSHLELANAQFDEVFIAASAFKSNVADPKYWFKRIRTKFDLAQEVDDADRVQLEELGLILLKKALFLFPENSSMKWLAEKVEREAMR